MSMYVTMRCAGRPLTVAKLSLFEEFLEWVERFPDAYDRFPEMMSCEGQGTWYSETEAGWLASELMALEAELGNGHAHLEPDFGPCLNRMIRVVLSCIRAREPVVIEVMATTPAMRAA